MLTGGRGIGDRLAEGVAVAVAEALPPEMLGVRDGFLRYFGRAAGRRVPVALVPQRVESSAAGLAVGDEEAAARAERRVSLLIERLGADYDFHTAAEGGLERVEIGGRETFFVRSWAVVAGLGGQCCGASGSLQVPERAIDELTGLGTRRKGGLVRALTGGVADRRLAVADATFNALCSLFFELYSGHPYRPPSG